jgi:hypothetical protein
MFCGKQICRNRAGHRLHVRLGGLEECALGLEPVGGDVVDELGDLAGDMREGDASVARDLTEHEIQRLDPRISPSVNPNGRSSCAAPSSHKVSCGFAFSATDSVRALDAMRRGLVIAQDSGIRANESFLAITLARVEAEQGDPLAALDYATLAIRRHHDSGNVAFIRPALTILAAFLDRLGRCEPAATIAGFAFNPLSATTFPEHHHHTPPRRARRSDLRIARPPG